MAKELLEAGVPLERAAELFPSLPEKVLNAAAREIVATGKRLDAGLGQVVLERSVSAVKDSQFVDKHIASLTQDAPDELIDPLFFTLMTDPVVISTGYVLDRSSVLDDNGQLKFRNCPFTRAALKNEVYPLVDRRKKLHEFKEQRLEAMRSTAQTLLESRGFAQFDEVIRAAESFVDDLGATTYFHQAKKLAELRLAAAEFTDRMVTPSEFAQIFIRIHRASDCSDAHGEGSSIQQQVMMLVSRAREALAVDKLEEASEWCKACETVNSECKLPLPVARLRLDLAKKQGIDLRLPRILAYRELKGDENAIKQFLQDEQITHADVIDKRPTLLCCGRISDRTADDEWHSAQMSQPIDTTVELIIVTAGSFRDQNWGNRKANLGLALYDAEGAFVSRCNLFGTYRTPECTYGRAPSRTLQTEEVVVSARPGFKYSLEYTVGGGGGHSIEVEDFRCMVYPHASQARIACRLQDPEGDEGNYRGPLDGDGKASGYGELEYDDGDIFVGSFLHGQMIEGAVYRASQLRFTMRDGSWTIDPNEEIAKQHPLTSIIVAGDLNQAVEPPSEDEYMDYESDDS
eukprot:TRINITY_DN9819_c0_g1_i1.p1 TRINITY_DN9819_c0_g1~~TRINITY_DN9819_c0_g1_i1.p1  ORF type:complete len:591 (-),score=98.70 TRINITY_DN9819_c0_g1_i1:195-1916(-)